MISDETWRPQLVEFSLQTIGIKDVFVHPPSGELTGKIKSCPEDFIVREILSLRDVNDPNAQLKEKELKVADILDSVALESAKPIHQYVVDIDTITNDDLSCKKYKELEEESITNMNEYQVEYESTHEDVLKAILTKCISVTNSKFKGETAYHNLENMHQIALKRLDQQTDNMSSDLDANFVIPPINDNVIILLSSKLNDNHSNNGKYRNRSTLHKTLKLVFPLLKTCTWTEQESQDWMKQNELGLQDINTNNRCIKVELDKTFYDLVPFLHDPSRDLLKLYLYRNSGFHSIISDIVGKEDNRRDGCNQNKRRRTERRCTKNQSDIDRNIDQTMEVWLHLKPNINKETRKELHHIISKACKDFVTSTVTDIPLNGLDSEVTTAVITVNWSKKVQMAYERTMSSKIFGPKKTDNQVITLCVMKKRNIEHMVAINHLTSALRCPPSDIGLCGIKDMRAVTYQFCTLSHLSPDQARRANSTLFQYGIQLGNFESVNWKLNIGNHQGNDFRVTVKDIKLVRIKDRVDGFPEERYEKTNESDIQSALIRVNLNGFVNFFGEQRVGNAGPPEKVGIRSFDIGKAMLKGDYSLAIDHLLQGRDRDVSGEIVESQAHRKIRQIWQSSQRDPHVTLEAFPQNTNIMSRERKVLQGLRRYGVDKPLEALRTLNISIRLFWITSYQSYVWNHMASERMIRFGAKVVPGDLFIDKTTNEVALVVDETATSIFDVVLPLPGYNIMYPSHILGKLYKDMLEHDGINFRKDAIPEATAKGAYRHLIVKSQGSLKDCVSNERGNLNAIFEFQLPKGSFATMFLRELLGTTIAR